MAAIGRSRAGGATAKADDKKKKIVLAGACVLLVGVLAIQGPRFLKQVRGSSSATTSAASAPSTDPVAPGTDTTGSPGTAPVTTPAPPLSPRLPKQFAARDPFAPLIRETPAGSSAAAAGASSGPANPSSPSDPVGFSVTNPSAPTAAPSSSVAAVIWINDRPQIVSLSQRFPAGAPAFRLVSVSAKAVKIRVAGGTFADGRSTITVPKGRGITLVNTATGVRYDVRFATTTQAPTAQPTSPAGS